MEIEIRARIDNINQLEKKIKLLENIKETKSNDRQVDIYLKHEKDTKRKMVIRIRKNYTDNKALLTFKGSAPEGITDIAWDDYDTPILNPEKLEKILLNNGYVYVCIIDKIRQSFSFKNYEINIDNIRDLGLFIEIEKNGEESEVNNIKKDILKTLINLGIKKEDLIEKGYVSLILEKNTKKRRG